MVEIIRFRLSVCTSVRPFVHAYVCLYPLPTTLPIGVCEGRFLFRAPFGAVSEGSMCIELRSELYAKGALLLLVESSLNRVYTVCVFVCIDRHIFL